MTDMIIDYKLLPEITQWSFVQQQGFLYNCRVQDKLSKTETLS